MLRAFINSCLSRDWHLDIVGPWYSQDYVDKLSHIIDNSGMTHRVHFHGPKYGDEKFSFLRKAWALVAPSFTEVIGLVNLEASANYIPTMQPIKQVFLTGLRVVVYSVTIC